MDSTQVSYSDPMQTFRQATGELTLALRLLLQIEACLQHCSWVDTGCVRSKVTGGFANPVIWVCLIYSTSGAKLVW